MATWKQPFLSAAVAMVANAHGAHAQSECADFKWSIDRESTAFAGEGQPTVVNGSPLPGVMEAANLKLAEQGSVAFTTKPTHKPKHEPAYAGVFSLPPIAAADTYQVTLSADAWIDVEQGGKLLKEAGFTGSHTCKTVRKSVRFDLGVGSAIIEISDSPTDVLKIEVLPKAK